jgi:Ras-related protein Rab-32
MRRYVEGKFTANYQLTIGCDFAVKTETVSREGQDDLRVNLQLWDVAGHERFGSTLKTYFRYAIGAVVVFDLQRDATLDATAKWRGQELNSKVVLQNGEPIPAILLANKCDVPGMEVDAARLDEFCREHNFAGWFATSAKENIGIDEAFQFLIEKILEVADDNRTAQEARADVVQIEGGGGGSSASQGGGAGASNVEHLRRQQGKQATGGDCC